MQRGGNPPRQRSGGGVRSLLEHPAGAWTTFNIALSALFYLFDFATNLLTLRTYYFYSVYCPKVYYPYPPLYHYPPLADRPECNVIMEGHSFTTVFYLCLSLMAAAHLSNTLIFWVTLDPSEHPLRLAYFLPLIHLSRLLKVLWRSCSCNSLEDLQDRGQKESSSLYNVLAAALETAPQLMLQFHVVLQFRVQGEYHEIMAEPVPKALIVSLLASLVSGTYNGSVAVLSLLQKHPSIMPPLRWKACIAMLAGLHILTAMSTQTLITTALAEDILLVMFYLFAGVIVTWIFFAVVLRKSQHDSKAYRRSNHKWVVRWMIHGLHSLALAHVSLFIGPMYAIVKLFDRPTFFLVWGTLLHIFMELVGLGAVVSGIWIPVRLNYWLLWITTCSRVSYSAYSYSFSCHVFLEVVCPLILVLLVSTLVFANIVAKRDTNSCDSELQLAEQDEQQLTVLDAVSNESMETLIAPAEYISVDPKVGSPHHIHSSITTISCDESPLLPSVTPPTSSKLQFVSISFVALFIKRVVLRHHKIKNNLLHAQLDRCN